MKTTLHLSTLLTLCLVSFLPASVLADVTILVPSSRDRRDSCNAAAEAAAPVTVTAAAGAGEEADAAVSAVAEPAPKRRKKTDAAAATRRPNLT